MSEKKELKVNIRGSLSQWSTSEIEQHGRWIIKKQNVLETLTWTKFNKINSCVTKARDIVWDAVVRVYTQLLINSPSSPTNSYKSVMGEDVVDVDSIWLTMMPTNRQLHHLTLSFSSLHVRNCSSLGKRLLTLQEEEFPPQYEEKYSQPCCCTASILRHVLHEKSTCIPREVLVRVEYNTREAREFHTPFQCLSPVSLSDFSLSPAQTTWKQKKQCWPTISESLFTFSASLTYVHHNLMKLIKENPWILKEHNNFSCLWKVERDIPNGFG